MSESMRVLIVGSCVIVCDRDQLAALLMQHVVAAGAVTTLDGLPPRASDRTDGAPESTTREQQAERLIAAHQTRAIKSKIPRHPKHSKENFGRDTPDESSGEADQLVGSRVARTPDPAPRRAAPTETVRTARKADTLGPESQQRQRVPQRSPHRHST